MFTDMLYYLGFLPKIVQIGILIVCALVGFQTLKTSSNYLNQPILVFLCYYTMARFIKFLFGTNNSTAALWIILIIYFGYMLFVRLGLWGIVISIIILLCINGLNIYSTILSHPIFNIAVTLIAIHIICSFMDISLFREIVYLILSIPLLIFINPAMIVEAVFLFEILIRCIFKSHICIDSIAKFFCFIVTCFIGVYLIELAFAHFWLSLIILLVISFILKTIS